jgi:glyoxylase-like metal-dependent hydrolase (beta-lactamase superfamily II)
MGRKLRVAAAISVVVLGMGAVYLYHSVTSLESEHVAGDVHIVFGLGGNVGILKTSVGAVVVDTMTFPIQARGIRELASQLGGGPARAIINTHYHSDHTHGNPAWPSGIRVVATERTRDYLNLFDAEFWQDEAGGTAPNDTFEQTHEMRIGGKTIRSYYLGRGHTGGDLVVLFTDDRVLHAGDLFFHRSYPNIDLEAGGSVRDWSTTLEQVLTLDFDHVIPGHGPVASREDLVGFARFMRELAETVGQAAADGLTLEQTLESVDLNEDEGYRPMAIPLIMNLDRDFVVKRAWQEATGAVKPAPLPSE